MTKIRQFTRASAKERESCVVFVTEDFKLVGVPLEGWAIAEDPLEDFSIISPVVYSRYRDQMYPAFELAEDTGVGHHRSLLYGRAVLGVFFWLPERTGLNSTAEEQRADPHRERQADPPVPRLSNGRRRMGGAHCTCRAGR